MKKNIASKFMKQAPIWFLIIILGSLLFFPLISSAGTYLVNSQERSYQGLVPCGGHLFDEIGNIIGEELPCQFCHFFVMLDGIVDFLLTYIVFPVAVLLLVIGGAIFLLSAGNPSAISQGKSIMTSTIIGLVIIFGSWLFLSLFFTAIGLSEFGRGIWPQGWFTINCPIKDIAETPALPNNEQIDTEPTDTKPIALEWKTFECEGAQWRVGIKNSEERTNEARNVC